MATMLRTAGRLISEEDAAERIVDFFRQEFGTRFPDAVYEDLQAGFKASWQQGQNFPVRKDWKSLPVPEGTIDWFAKANHFDVSSKLVGYDKPVRAAVLAALESGNNADRLKVLQTKLGQTLNDPPLRNHLENIFRNLSSRASVFSRVKRYEELKIEEIEIVAIMDRRTSAICKTMDGRRIRVETVSSFVDEFTSKPYGPDFWKSFTNPPESAFRGNLERLSTANLMDRLNLPLPPFHFRCRTTTVVSQKVTVKNRTGQELKGEIVEPPGNEENNRHYSRFEDWKNLEPLERLSKIETLQKRASWDAEQLAAKWDKHGDTDFNLKTREEYRDFSKKILREFDAILLYTDRETEQKRFGFFNESERAFLAVDDDFQIRNLFKAKKSYIKDMVPVQ